jgi:plastocyanin
MEPNNTDTSHAWRPARLTPKRRQRGPIVIVLAGRNVVLLIALIVASLASGVAAVLLITSQPYLPNGSPVGSAGPAASPEGKTAPAANPPAATSSAEAAVAAGHALAGNGTGALSLPRAEELGNAWPPGATVDARANTVRFTTATVRLAILASPPGADMKFRIAGLNDPTISLPRGAQVTVELINGDNDMAHMWVLAAGTADSDASVDPRGSAGIAAAPPLGDPTATGQPTETVTFAAPAPGSYHYYCAFPGHAAAGMRGSLIVRA